MNLVQLKNHRENKQTVVKASKNSIAGLLVGVYSKVTWVVLQLLPTAEAIRARSFAPPEKRLRSG